MVAEANSSFVEEELPSSAKPPKPQKLISGHSSDDTTSLTERSAEINVCLRNLKFTPAKNRTLIQNLAPVNDWTGRRSNGKTLLTKSLLLLPPYVMLPTSKIGIRTSRVPSRR